MQDIYDKQFTENDYLRLLQPNRTSSQEFRKHSKETTAKPSKTLNPEANYPSMPLHLPLFVYKRTKSTRE